MKAPHLQAVARIIRFRAAHLTSVQNVPLRQSALLAMLLAVAVAGTTAWSQTPAPPATASQPQSTPQSAPPPPSQPQTQPQPQLQPKPQPAAPDTDATPRPAPASLHTTIAEGNKEAWTLLHDAATNGKPDMRIQALGALSALNGSVEARKLIAAGLQDNERDVRVAAVLAVQAMKDRRMFPALRKALDDSAPEVSFAAATTLWRMGDTSGRDVLYDVLDGDRKASTGLIGSSLHTANKDLHSPSTLAMLGAKQGAYALLGPFGIGLDALEYARKGTSGNTARVLAATLLADKRDTATRDQMIAALQDKDSFVRTAAAHALGDYRGKVVTDPLMDAFCDAKPSVRLVAAASYIRATGGAATTMNHNSALQKRTDSASTPAGAKPTAAKP